MKKTVLFMILSTLTMTSSFAGVTTDAKVSSYDGIIHLELNGKVAKDYFNSIRIPAKDNGIVVIKVLNEGVHCSKTKASSKYNCTISIQDGSNGEE